MAADATKNIRKSNDTSTTDNNQRPTDGIPAPQTIETPEALYGLVKHLMQVPIVAVDTESNSLYAYHEQVCLLQFSIPGVNYIVDPLALAAGATGADNANQTANHNALKPLAPLFASPNVEKVFHAMDYDLMVLRRDFGFTFRNLFDTMWAARVLGWSQVGLANILQEKFGVHVNKRYQRYNWGKRPLDPAALKYAWMDTHYLLKLSDIQKAELRAKGRWEEAQEIFTYLRQNGHTPPQEGEDERIAELFWRIRGVYDLPPSKQRALYQLHQWREKTAERLDRPPAKVISNTRLVNLARVHPKTYTDMKASEALTHHQMRRFGSSILGALRAPAERLPSPPRSERPPDEVIQRYQTLKAWRKEKAIKRGVDSDVILPNATLWELATQPPDTLQDLLEVPGIGPWRQQSYGPDILRLTTDK
jgi:ribonuclease D